MTVSTSVSRSGPYAGAGTVGPFTVGFRFLDNTHLLVIRTDSSGVETPLVLSVDFTATGAESDDGGAVTLTTALAAGTTLTIQRNVPLTQLADYTQSDSFPAQSHEDALDKLTMIAQQTNQLVNGALRVPENAAALPTFPALAARASKFAAFDTLGNPAAVGTLPAGAFTTGSAFVDEFTGDGVTVNFTLSQNPGSQANLFVSIGGLDQRNGIDFTWTSGTTLTFTTAPPVATIQAHYTNAVPVGVADAANVSFLPLGAATTRTVQAKLRDTVSVMDEGAVVDGVTDDTAKFNLATHATAVYSSALYAGIAVPAGTAKLFSTNTSVFLRKGQTLIGAGMGATVLDLTAGISNTVDHFVLGKASSGAVDAGGQVAEVTRIMFLGGSGTNPVLNPSACAGWKVSDVFFSAPGIAISAGGSDGLVHGCIFDLGLNHVIVSAQNLLLSNNLHYQGNFPITIGSNSVDVTVSGSQFEYFAFCAVLLATSATGITNLKIDNCNFVQNAQYGTTLGAILIASTSADFVVNACRFRNIVGNAIAYSTGLGNSMVVRDSVFNGTKTASGYAQGTTMGGVDATNTKAIVQGCSFANLGGQPITLGGAAATTWIIRNCDFSGNTGGSTDILITNSNAGSKVYIKNCTSDRQLVNVQGTVPVFYDTDNVDTSSATVASAATIALPYGKRFVSVTGTTGITSITATAADVGRQVVLQFSGALTVTDGSNLKLAGNFVTTADDTLTLACDATNWYELARSVN